MPGLNRTMNALVILWGKYYLGILLWNRDLNDSLIHFHFHVFLTPLVKSWLNRLKQPEFSKSKAVSEFTHHALGRERSGGGEPAAEQQQVLNSLIDQSRKNKLLYLQSLTELVRAKYLLKTVTWLVTVRALRVLQGKGLKIFLDLQGQSPVEVFAALHRSFALNTFHGIKGIRGSYHLLCANVWQLYGEEKEKWGDNMFQLTHIFNRLLRACLISQ